MRAHKILYNILKVVPTGVLGHAQSQSRDKGHAAQRTWQGGDNSSRERARHDICKRLWVIGCGSYTGLEFNIREYILGR